MSDKAEAKKPEAKKGHFMDKGKAVTSKVGILSDGDEVKAEYFADGKKTIDALITSGHIVK